MRWGLLLVAAAACGGGDVYHARKTGDQGVTTHAELADDSGFKPTYSKADLETALIAERGKEARDVQRLADLQAQAERDPTISPNTPRIAEADLAVRRRYLATLEACQASGVACPPRLDEPPWTWDYDPDLGSPQKPPPLDAPLRYDVASWQVVTAELHGRACACRTIACVDGIGVALDQLEGTPMRVVQDDDASIASITAARECLFRLRGKEVAKHTVAPGEVDR